MADNDQALQTAENEFKAARQREAQVKQDIENLRDQLAAKQAELVTRKHEKLDKGAKVSNTSCL